MDKNHKNLVKILRDTYGLDWAYIANRLHCDSSTLRKQYTGVKPIPALRRGLERLLQECERKAGV